MAFRMSLRLSSGKLPTSKLVGSALSRSMGPSPPPSRGGEVIGHESPISEKPPSGGWRLLKLFAAANVLIYIAETTEKQAHFRLSLRRRFLTLSGTRVAHCSTSNASSWRGTTRCIGGRSGFLLKRGDFDRHPFAICKSGTTYPRTAGGGRHDAANAFRIRRGPKLPPSSLMAPGFRLDSRGSMTENWRAFHLYRATGCSAVCDRRAGYRIAASLALQFGCPAETMGKLCTSVRRQSRRTARRRARCS